MTSQKAGIAVVLICKLRSKVGPEAAPNELILVAAVLLDLVPTAV